MTSIPSPTAGGSRSRKGIMDQIFDGWEETGRTFIVLAGLTFALFIVISIGLVLQGKLLKEPVLSVKGFAPSMSSQFFADMLGMEVPGLSSKQEADYTFSGNNVLTFLTQLLTNVNPNDLRTLVASEIPGIREDTVPLKGQTDLAAAPIDYAPPPGLFKDEQPRIADSDDLQEPEVEVGDEPGTEPQPDTDAPSVGVSAPQDEPILSTGDKKVVFIYHSHNRESWVPELRSKGITNINDAFDAETNITLVGERLAQKLEDLGVGSSHSDTDYFTSVKNYNWNFSYKYSEKTVEAALAGNRDLLYFFDIHRDSQRRDLTTVEIDGKSYAQVYFIIGHRNPEWEKNEAFATKLHDQLEKDYPGLSRGIWGKGAKNGNGEYNQSISPNSVLIEVGGPENTLEESYRTADALAKVIADVYWEAERVNAGG